MTFVRDCVLCILCWLAFTAYVRAPWEWSDRIAYALLPWAGCHAYNDTWADFRNNMRWLRERSA